MTFLWISNCGIQYLFIDDISASWMIQGDNNFSVAGIELQSWAEVSLYISRTERQKPQSTDNGLFGIFAVQEGHSDRVTKYIVHRWAYTA